MAIPPSAELKLPRELPAATVVTATDMLVGDNGVAVQKVTPPQIVDAAIPLASQAEAEAGTDNTKRMSPLRVAQSIAFQGVSATTLASTGGASLVGASSGATVQGEIDILKQVDSALQNDVGIALANSTTAINTANAASASVGIVAGIANDALSAVDRIETAGETDGAALVPFLPSGVSVAFQSSQQKMRERPTLADFGAFGDGALHTVAEWIIPGVKGRYANLAAVQVDYPFVTATTEDANWAALTKAEAYARSSGIGRVDLGIGNFAYSKTWVLTTRGIAVCGVVGFQGLGTGSVPSTLTWHGGAEPMIRTSATRYRFQDFAIRNLGLATDFHECAPGSQSFHWERLYCLTSGHTRFTRAFIHSDGNRVGYSHMRECLIGNVAPVIFNIDGAATSNAITNLLIDGRCIFTADASAGPITIVKLIDEGIENLTIRDCTFNQYTNELTIVDTRTTSYARPIDVFVFQANEIDALPANDQSGWRNFYLTNVSQILFDGNKISSGGTKQYIADLVNSNIVSARGNYFSAVLGLFNADDNSSVRGFYSHGTGVGRNAFLNRRAGIVQLAYGAGIAIDGRRLDQSKHEVCYIDVTNNSGFSIAVDNTSPEFWTIGQVFTVVIRNVSSAAIASGVFNAIFFSTQGATVAPAVGFSRSYTFVWDGTKAIEISRATADVANS